MDRATLPTSFIQSAFRTKVEYEASLLLPDTERLAAEAAAAAKALALGSSVSTSERAATASEESSPGCSRAVASPKMTAVLIIGMAGSGKTTLMQRLNAHLYHTSTPYYVSQHCRGRSAQRSGGRGHTDACVVSWPSDGQPRPRGPRDTLWAAC